MIILALDTTGSDCSACILHGDRVLAHITEPLGRGHAERLAPMVVEVMGEAGVTPDRIDRVAVCTGPGGFTGLRVALSFAKGFALPRRTPVLGFDALHIRANAAAGAVTVFRDVKRGQVFAARYVDGVPETPSRAMTAEDMQAFAASGPVCEASGCDVRVMANMAMAADPECYPAEPLYARAPDAKLPGGKALPVLSTGA